MGPRAHVSVAAAQHTDPQVVANPGEIDPMTRFIVKTPAIPYRRSQWPYGRLWCRLREVGSEQDNKTELAMNQIKSETRLNILIDGRAWELSAEWTWLE